MASLSSLNSTLNYWKNQVTAANKKIKCLKRRLSDVKTIKKNLLSVADDNASDVNGRIRNLRDKLVVGCDCPQKNASIAEILSGKDEKILESDTNLSVANSEFQKELNDINRKLGEAETSLERAQSEVAKTKSAVTTEERRVKEEEKNKK